MTDPNYFRQFRTPAEVIEDEKWEAHQDGDCGPDCEHCQADRERGEESRGG